MTFGDRVKNKREELGLSQEELANLLGYSDKSSISKIEKNQRDVTRSKIIEIAKALKTTASYLMGWDEETSDDHYYIDDEAREIANEIAQDKDLKMLFSAARDVSAEDLKAVHTLMKSLKKKEMGDDD